MPNERMKQEAVPGDRPITAAEIMLIMNRTEITARYVYGLLEQLTRIADSLEDMRDMRRYELTEESEPKDASTK